MTVKYSIGFLMLLVCCLAEVSSRPSNESSVNEETTVKTSTKAVADTEDGSISYQEDSNINVEETATKDIVEKIKTINSFLNKPTREQLNLNKPYSDKPPGIDRETLLKIQQIIASAKLTKDSIKNQEQENYFLNEDEYRKYYSRSSKQIPNYFYQSPMIPYMSNPYAMNVPVVSSPSYNEMLGYATNNNLKSLSNGVYQTRQQQPFFPGFPSFPTFSSFPSFSLDNFQPFAQWFPVLIKNPFVAFSQGGGLDNFVEYGQSADVCNRKQKSSTDKNESNVENLQEPHLTENNNIDIGNDNTNSEKTISRKSRALNKRTVSTKAPEQEIEEGETGKKIYASKPSITRKPSKRPSLAESSNDLKQSDPEGDLRFPFSSDFTWFWNKKPVAPSPGFFINKLKVRKGGVAIAGPGGIATAGRGGTAIVGPGGLAYTKPGGLAIAGPHARVVALSPYSDLISSLNHPHQQGYDFRALQSIREGKIVATGPVIYYHPIEQILFFTNRYYTPVTKTKQSHRRNATEVFNYDGQNFVHELTQEPTYIFHINPRAFAKSGENGVAISNPISSVIIRKGESGLIIYTPKATAIAGPGGIAHAEAIQYIPFYGGAKGQYLEVKKDTAGSILSEKVVAEESISSENIVKNKDESLLSKVLAANLQSLKTLSTNLLKIHNVGRKTGRLGNQEKNRFKGQLYSLGEAASNTIKLIDEIGDDIDVLFKKNATLTRKYDDTYDDDVGEEGVSIDSPTDTGESYLEGTIIAEAKPVGLAVIGESGLAASRPQATAVAASGVAIARPVGTAIAGIDPTLLGIDFHVNHSEQKIKYKGQSF
ncbi:uncharacterized protein LOC124530486 [Vanessa cardui]|uniref:uncharacterized protein LOC124530486 n=1 Tax=Vanessa cardui TaxID=171605 RepID=UPI001F1447E6|nr:uncharacterized protein LOC124530486 [Vanessa cardui]